MEFPTPNPELIIPELMMIGFAMAVLLLNLFKKDRITIAVFALFGVFVTGLYQIAHFPLSFSESTFSKMFIVDGYAGFFKYIFYVNLALTIFISMQYKALDHVPPGEYYSLLLFSSSGMMIMASSADLILLYLGLELMAISLYVLAGIIRTDRRCNESALKYFLLGAFSSAFLLYGMALVFGVTGTTNLSEIAAAIQAMDLFQNSTVLLALIFMIVAFSFKIALVPFHLWSPDVYEGAPTSVTAFMSIGPKAAGFAVIGRVLMNAFGKETLGSGVLEIQWQSILWVLAILTMGYGNIVALVQTNIKRMLAYSSIAHAGYIIIGVLVGTPQGLTSTMNYLMIYTFMNLGAFAVVILMNREGLIGEEIDDYQGLAKKHPLTSLLMLIFMFSLAGIPPTAGFVAKFYLFVGAVNGGFTHLVIIAVLFSAVSAYYYLRIVVYMYMREPIGEIRLGISAPLNIALALTAISVMMLGIFPSKLFELVKAAILS